MNLLVSTHIFLEVLLVAAPNEQPVGGSRSQWYALGLLLTCFRPNTVAANLGMQLGLSHIHLTQAEQAASNCGLFCSSSQVTQGWSQAESVIDLY